MSQGILVTGGTGTLGRALVEDLRANGQQVRILSRHPGRDTVVGDLTTGTGLEAAVTGISTVIHCATDGRTDVRAGRNLIAAARTAGVRRVDGYHPAPEHRYGTGTFAEFLPEMPGTTRPGR